MKKNNVVAEILKELAEIGYSGWDKTDKEFSCSIYREDVGQFKCCLRYDRSNVDLILVHDDIEAVVTRVKRSDRNNKVIQIFNSLDDYFKEKISMERQRVVDAFLNKK